MNLPQLTVSISVAVRPRAAIAVTLPSIKMMGTVYSVTASGGAKVGGAATLAVTYSLPASGGVKLGGAANVVGDPLIVSGSGGVQVSGAAGVVYSPVVVHTVTASGGVVVSGTAPSVVLKVVTYIEIMQGGVQIDGAAHSFDSSFYPTGSGLQITGQATVDSYALNPRVDFTLPAMTASMVGMISGVAMPMPALRSSMVGLLGVSGSMNAVLPSMTSALTGGSPRVELTFPALSTEMTGNPAGVGSMVMVLPPLTSSIVGTPPIVGHLVAQLPVIAAELNGLIGNAGVLAATLPALTTAMRGYPGLLGDLDATLPALTSSMSGYGTITGAMEAVLPSFQATFLGTIRDTLQLIMVTNTVNSAVSFYEGLQTNSMCAFDGKFLVADSTGIHVMDADNDNAVNIDASFKTGALSLGSAQQKKISDVYVGMRAAGDLILSVTVDERTPYDYTLSPHDVATLKARRVPTGKGLKGKYWQFELANTNGCDFDIDAIDFSVTDTDRKI